MSETIQQIALQELVPCPDNRLVGGFDEGKLLQLAESIAAIGVQQPAVVRPKGDGYELVAGERRWRAARLAGLSKLPCIVRELDDVTCLRIRLIENLQRDDLHPLDEADGYGRLIERAGYDVEKLAAEVHKSASYVYQRLKLRDLVPEARKLLVDGVIQAGHAILIARLAPKIQTEAMTQLIGWGGEPIAVRHLDEWIHRHVLMELSKACWKLDDEDLAPKAGSCQACPKRTGFQPALFADMSNGGKHDYCTDRACFTKKQQALVNQKRRELKDVPHLEAVKGWGGGGTPKGALLSYDWTECKKSEPGAQRVLIVGGETPGRLTYGKARKEAVARLDPSPKVKAEREKEERKRAIAEAFRKQLYSRTVAAAEKKLKQRLPAEVLRLAIQCLYDGDYESREAMVAAEAWENTDAGFREIGKMGEAELRLTLLKLAIARHVDYAYLRRGGDPLLEAAKLYQVDLKEARKGAANQVKAGQRRCRVCGCTDDDCSQCIAKTGEACHWVEKDLCSACASDAPT